MSFTLKWDHKPFEKKVKKEIAKKIKAGGKMVLADARRMAPVGKEAREGSRGYKRRKPGSLKKSGRMVFFENEDGSGVYVKFGGRGYMVDGVDTFYAIFVELTEKQFLRTALKKNRQKIYRSLNNLV